MDTTQRLASVKSRISTSSQEEARRQIQSENALKAKADAIAALKAEFDVDTVDAAKVLKAKLEVDLEAELAKLEKALDELEA